LKVKKIPLIPFVFLVLLGVFAAGHAGCAAGTGGTGPGYFKILDSWTRVEKIYEGFEPRLLLKATYKNRSFRYAYIDRYADDYKLTPRHRDAMRAKALEISELYNEFILAAHTPTDRWNDFEESDSIWKLYLEDNLGNRLTPISIDKLDAKDPLLQEFFPYIGLWSSIYIVRFPKYSEASTESIPGEATDYLRLTVAGALGSGELEWRLKKKGKKKQ
jgi:hypothetical protein